MRADSDAFRVLTGKPKVYLKRAESGNKRQQTFCPECGTPIYSAAEIDPPTVSIRLGTCRQRAQLTPRTPTACRSRAASVDSAAPARTPGEWMTPLLFPGLRVLPFAFQHLLRRFVFVLWNLAGRAQMLQVALHGRHFIHHIGRRKPAARAA